MTYLLLFALVVVPQGHPSSRCGSDRPQTPGQPPIPSRKGRRGFPRRRGSHSGGYQGPDHRRLNSRVYSGRAHRSGSLRGSFSTFYRGVLWL